MKTIELKVARIGNSRGVRLPAETLCRYRIGGVVLMEERVDGILLHPKASTDGKLSWEETSRHMAAAQENWGEWDAAVGDGIDGLPWDKGRAKVAEKHVTHETRSVQGRQKRRKGGGS